MYTILSTENTIQSKINYMKSDINTVGFPTLAKLYKLYLNILSNLASCKRSNSCLRRLNNYLRNTIGLNHPGVLQI